MRSTSSGRGNGAGAGSPSGFATIPGASVRLVSMTPASDGGRMLALRFSGFAPEAHFTVSLDVDDRLPNSALGHYKISLLHASKGAP